MNDLSLEAVASFLKNNTVQITATQKKVCFPIIERIYKKMCAGILFEGIKVLDDKLCDGHHRYIASLMANVKIEIFLGTLHPESNNYRWPEVIIELIDWDTPAKIQMLNEEDAKFNNKTIQEIIQLLN